MRMNEENYGSPKGVQRTARGYRLKISTHNMIKSLQELTNYDADRVITESCLLMYKKVLSEKESNLFNVNQELK